MATKTITTRIRNKIDTYQNWKASTGKLLNGEIAIVRVDTTEVNEAGDVVKVPALLMKVGDGETQFDSLPWLSAKASDVYDWAKKGTAMDVPVTVNNTTSTLGAYLAKVDTNAQGVAANLNAINTLNGNDTTAGSVSKAIKDAIAALDANTESGTGNFVKAVAQSDGRITVTKGNIAETDLPDISASKIKVDADTTLNTKLVKMTSDIAANTAKLTGHTDEAINTLIDTKINGLDGGTDIGSAGAGKYVSSVVQTNGKVATTYTEFPTAGASAGIVKLGATGGAATYDSIFGSDGKGGINAQAVTGGVHFIGITTTDITTDENNASKAVTIKMSETETISVDASAGDIVIYNTREFIWTGSIWEELGDVTRIGNLEAKVDNLDYSNTTDSGTNKFVTNVTQTDGKIAVTFAQPMSTNVSHGSDTVSGVLNSLSANKANASDVYTKTETDNCISNAINSLEFAVPAVPTSGTNTSLEFIDSVSQENGKISATKKKIPDATLSAKGAVQLSSAIDNDSEALAATPKAVKAAHGVAVAAAANAADAQGRVGTVESKYLSLSAADEAGYSTFCEGKDNAAVELIFDCGGAPQA